MQRGKNRFASVNVSVYASVLTPSVAFLDRFFDANPDAHRI